MSKNRIVLILGIILLFLPFSGFPSAWKSFWVFVNGIFLIVLAVHSSVRRRMLGVKRKRITRTKKEPTDNQFSDSIQGGGNISDESVVENGQTT